MMYLPIVFSTYNNLYFKLNSLELSARQPRCTELFATCLCLVASAFGVQLDTPLTLEYELSKCLAKGPGVHELDVSPRPPFQLKKCFAPACYGNHGSGAPGFQGAWDSCLQDSSLRPLRRSGSGLCASCS